MNAVAPKGWCPTLARPMASGDGLLVRLKPRVLPARAARALAEAALRHGNGTLELTSRASIQVRGLSEAGVTPFGAAMLAAGLGDAPAAERVIASPLAGDDPAANPLVAPVAAALLAWRAELAGLPAKFGFAVDGGGALPLGGVPADISIVLRESDATVGIDGAALGVACDAADAAGVALDLTRAFVRLAATVAAHPRRMRALVAEVGAAAVFAAADLRSAAMPPSSWPDRTAGWIDYGGGRGAFLAGLPFGAMDAATLAKLADLSEQHGDATLRLTPWRAWALTGVANPGRLAASVAALGLIGAPDDPRVAVAACPGSPACASATVATRPLATTLAGVVGLHVSGCAKGCAHPRAAAVTLVGRAGHFDLVRHGRAGDAPERRGLTEADIASLFAAAPADAP